MNHPLMLENIERCCQLHGQVEIFYTVDGYQASLSTRNGDLCVVSVHAEDVMTATLSLDARLKDETLESVRAKTVDVRGLPERVEA